MARLFTAFVERLDSVYRDLPYFVQRKARLLAGLTFLLLVIIPLNAGKLLWLQPPEMGFRIAFNACMWLGAVLASVLIAKGRLEAAGTSLVLFTVIIVHGLLLFVPRYYEPLSAAFLMFAFDLFYLLLALVFSSRPVAIAVLLTAVTSHTIFHFAEFHGTTIPGSMGFAADTLFREGFITIALVFCLGIALDSIMTGTYRRSAEMLSEVRATNENLGQLVAERTKELESATALANEASRAKGDFLANMSHEIRTPLNGIVASSELLLDRKDLPPGAAEHARIISESSEHLLRLIGDVLDLSKIEAGQLDLEVQEFEMASLAEECVRLLRTRAGKSGVRIAAEIDPPLRRWFRGDGFRLRQILLNLMSNAVKFTPDGGSVRLKIGGADGERVRFEVRDTGIGMDESTRKHLFERYRQAEASTSRRYGGTGLGLAISFRIVELMGGRLEVESAAGTGSTFSFTIPLHAIDGVSESRVASHEQIAPLGLNVLVADDNAVNRRVYQSQLERLGCSAIAASNGEEALVAILSTPVPDVVLMDCEMPVLDGWEATRRIRGWAEDPAATPAQRRVAEIPIVALTAATLPEDRQRCFDVGMTDFLPKPTKLASLQRALCGVRRLSGT